MSKMDFIAGYMAGCKSAQDASPFHANHTLKRFGNVQVEVMNPESMSERDRGIAIDVAGRYLQSADKDKDSFGNGRYSFDYEIDESRSDNGLKWYKVWMYRH